MESPVLAALVRAPELSRPQVQGVIATVATLAPSHIVDVAERSDLDDELRGEIIRRASRYLALDVLNRWPARPALLEVAVQAHGAFAGLVLYCEEQGWRDRATELASQVGVDEVEHLAAKWTRTFGSLPSAIRIALIHAALTETTARPRLTEMSEWERQQAMEQLAQEARRRAGTAWQLLEPAPELWKQLARDGNDAQHIRRILLDHAEQLTDDVLSACLPEVTRDDLRDGDDLFAGVRLSHAADRVRRWPRLRDIADTELRRVVQEAVEDGWAPDGRFTHWPELTALAELSDDTALLSGAVAATRHATKPDYLSRQRQDGPSWEEERARTVAALTTNPATPHADLMALLAALDEPALLSVEQHGEGDLRAAARTQLDERRRAADAGRPALIHVPSDRELAESDDPAAELAGHLKYLRARAEQRDTTCEALLRSRFTTPDILRALPAHRVLDSAQQADLTATMIIEACGDDTARWQAVADHLDSQPRKTVTFQAWLNTVGGAQ
ncbi:hypothetical protein [Amycolatopsis sp. NPDC059657]|uniref:hypothetical protein n=1 Tax=Amycolatopsis sp. NPDC059657 TaxID=3346899 RepID=UPI003670281E